jgi:hypothetical protein
MCTRTITTIPTYVLISFTMCNWTKITVFATFKKISAPNKWFNNVLTYG